MADNDYNGTVASREEAPGLVRLPPSCSPVVVPR